MNIRQQSGFTLVEIAIVLVIIGLLLGGILKGQELINSARVRNMADQGSAIQAAYYGFIDRYRQIPGDWLAAGAAGATIGIGQVINSPTVAGDGIPGNGRIDNNSYDEASGLWEQLSKAGFITGLYVGGAAAGTYTDGTRAPVSAFNGTIALSRFAGGGVGNDYQGVGGTRLAYVYGAQTPVNIMRELDVKLDDGVPTSGVVRAVVEAAGANLAAVLPGSLGNACVVANAWGVTADSQDCNALLLY